MKRVHLEKDSKFPASPLQSGVKSLSQAGLDEETSPTAPLPRSGTVRLKVCGLSRCPLKAQVLQFARLKGERIGLDASFQLQAFTML